MIELALRGAEVIGLHLSDIDWQRRRRFLPATKTERGRELPIPERVFFALRDYVNHARPGQTPPTMFLFGIPGALGSLCRMVY